MHSSFLALATLAIALPACSGATAVATDAGQDSNAAQAGDAGNTQGALDALDSTIVRIHIDHVFLGARPGCYPPYRPVDYDRATHTMSWPVCENDAGADEAGADDAAGSRVLSLSEAQEVEDVLATVTYQNSPPCGGLDGGEYYMITYDAAGNVVHKFSAQNINCYGYPAAPGIVLVYEELAKLHG